MIFVELALRVKVKNEGGTAHFAPFTTFFICKEKEYVSDSKRNLRYLTWSVWKKKKTQKHIHNPFLSGIVLPECLVDNWYNQWAAIIEQCSEHVIIWCILHFLFPSCIHMFQNVCSVFSIVVRKENDVNTFLENMFYS